MIRPPDINLKILALGAAFNIFALTIWAGSHPSQLDWNSAYAATAETSRVGQPGQEIGVTPAVYRASTTPQISGATGRCNPWDVSPEAMEVILREMVRRGWRPPTSDLALAGTQPDDGVRIEALYPDERVWMGSPRGTPPAETGDVVDVTITDAENEGAATPLTPAIPALPTTPALPEPQAPAISPPPAPPTN